MMNSGINIRKKFKRGDGMLIYFLLGLLFAVAQLFINNKIQETERIKKWPIYILSLMANFLVIFSLAWGYESILEQEIQAAMMGLLMFGGFGIIIAIVTYRIITKTEKKEKMVEKVTE